MKIIVKDISSKGLDLDEQIDQDVIGLTKDVLDCSIPLAIKARIERLQDTVLAKVHVKTKFAIECARCLDKIDRDHIFDCHLDYELDKTMEFIDLGEDIRQETILGIPPRIVCSEDCKGICAQCGVNLNREQCRCDQENQGQGTRDQ